MESNENKSVRLPEKSEGEELKRSSTGSKSEGGVRSSETYMVRGVLEDEGVYGNWPNGTPVG